MFERIDHILSNLPRAEDPPVLLNTYQSSYTEIQTTFTVPVDELLPTEVLAKIIESVEHVPTLAALARTSKYMSEVTYPILYSSFRELGSEISLIRFLRTILLNPDLSKHTKTFIGLSDGPCDTKIMEFLTSSELALFHKAAEVEKEYFEEGFPIDRLSFLYNGHGISLTALLFCLLPNLEEIQFFDCGHPETTVSVHKIGPGIFMPPDYRQCGNRTGVSFLERNLMSQLSIPMSTMID